MPGGDLSRRERFGRATRGGPRDRFAACRAVIKAAIPRKNSVPCAPMQNSRGCPSGTLQLRRGSPRLPPSSRGRDPRHPRGLHKPDHPSRGARDRPCRYPPWRSSREPLPCPCRRHLSLSLSRPMQGAWPRHHHDRRDGLLPRLPKLRLVGAVEHILPRRTPKPRPGVLSPTAHPRYRAHRRATHGNALP